MALDYGRTLTILVVEDDEAVAELIRTVLNRVSGWGATVVHDAAAASEVFRHVEIEVLVLDVNLPGISGVELLQHLRKDPHWHEPPVILMSAYPEQPAVRTAVVRGEAIRFIAKPFDVDDLVDAVQAAVGAQQSGEPSRSEQAAFPAGS
jgi:DNA-binding response OmpR family regulator